MFLTRLLSTPQSAAPEPIKVSTCHIPFVERLWLDLQAARGQIAAKREYLGESDRLGLKIATVTALAEQTEADTTAVHRATSELDRIKRVLEIGGEPTTPPKDWYCGHLTEPRKTKERDREAFPPETWANREGGRSTNVFRGAMPMPALQRLAATQEFLDEVRVYSPHYEHFTHHPNPQMLDPVLIGMVRFLGVPQYFELARWDIDGDLAIVFGHVAR